MPATPPPLPPARPKDRSFSSYLWIVLPGLILLVVLLLLIASPPPSPNSIQRNPSSSSVTTGSSSTTSRTSSIPVVPKASTTGAAASSQQNESTQQTANRSDRELQRMAPIQPGSTSTKAQSSNRNSSVSSSSQVHPRERSFQLNVGSSSISLRTGPQNPLMAPPGIASVVYVIDRSGSMAGGRFARVTRTLGDALQRLQPDQEFAILLFDDRAYRLDSGILQLATPANVSRLSDQLSAVETGSGTDPTDAMLIAIQLQPEVIVLLSDGEFSDLIVETITEANHASSRPCQINCIGLDSDTQTLLELAARNGPGTFIRSH